MIDEQYRQWINDEIDGTLSARDAEKLRNALQQDEELRTYYQEMKQAVQFLEDTPDLEPSPNLKKNILNAITLPPIKRPADQSWLNRLFPGERQRLALAFVTGVLLTLVLLLPVYYGHLSQGQLSGLSGTMIIPDEKAFIAVEELPPVPARLPGQISIKQQNHLFLVQIKIRSSAQDKLQVRFAREKLQLINLIPEPPAAARIQSSDTSISISNASSMNFRLLFRLMTNEPAPLTLTYTSPAAEPLTRKVVLRP